MAGYIFTDPTDVKLIILFIIKNYNRPLDNGQITEVFMSHNFVDYFAMQEYLDDMVQKELVRIDLEDGYRKYSLTEIGESAIENFKNNIPFSVRESILMSIKRYQKKLKQQTQIVTNCVPINELEYAAECSIHENGLPVISLSINAGSLEMANAACKKFRDNPQKAYSEIIRILFSE